MRKAHASQCLVIIYSVSYVNQNFNIPGND